MALPACFQLAEHVFPLARAHAAHTLRAEGWSQTRIADALQISQGMVSRYLRNPPANNVLAARLAAEIVDGLQGNDTASWCALLADGTDELDDLLRAERALLQASPVHVLGQVGLNIARMRPGASSATDVLAYPARIVAAGQRLVRPAPPAFGASQHLATCLLAWHAHDSSVGAVANIRGGLATQTDLELAGDGERTLLVKQALATANGPVRRIHDPGAVGIEACLYIAGPTAQAVVQEILNIATETQ